jgi:hypothetical protein
LLEILLARKIVSAVVGSSVIGRHGYIGAETLDCAPSESTNCVSTLPQSNGITPGAGKTYIKAGSHQPRLTVESMAADGITVAEHLRNELHWPKITLIGQSICCAKTCD